VPLNAKRSLVAARHPFCAALRVLVCFSALSLINVAIAQPSDSYLILTVAGNGRAGFGGDGGTATAASLSGPSAVAIDTSGNLYIADSGNSRLRKVAPGGSITTIAGNGNGRSSGDGGPATDASVFPLSGVAVDTSGNLYITDSLDNRIRKISPSGTITTIAGNGSAGFGYGGSGDNGPATTASLYSPLGVAVDTLGNLYIADTIDHRIRKVSPGGIITTIAGNGFMGFGGGGGFGGDGGPATAARLYLPEGAAVDTLGNLYIADSFNQRIRMVSSGGTITTIAGNGRVGFGGDGGPATAAQLSNPNGVAVDTSGNLYIADSGNGRIRKVSRSGVITTVAGGGRGGDGGPATAAQISPRGIAIDTLNNLYIADSSTSGVRKLVPSPQSTVGCICTIDQATQDFGPNGGSASVSVLASGSSCSWLAINYADWLTVTPAGIGNGTDLVTYTVAPNPNSAPRTTTIWIAGQSLRVNQSGAVCSFGVGARSVNLAASGVTGSTLGIRSNALDCQWSAAANVPWILVSGGNSGTGNGNVTYTVGVNTGALRTGTITVGSRTVYINQASTGGAVSSLATVANDGVVNGASYSATIAPGSFVTIYGQNLADTTTTWASAITDGKTLPKILGGVSVQINGKDCYVYYVQPTQVNVLTPPDTVSGPVDVDVLTKYGTATTTVNMEAVSPALFAYALWGKLYPVALFANETTLVAPDGALPGAQSRPAKEGDYLVLYATGLGQTTPPYPAGQVLSKAFPISDLSQVHILIGGQPAAVLFAGMTFAGVFQVNIQVPAGIAAGDLPVVLQIGTQSSPQDTVLTFSQ
jgi:uncharacterized protein (TIGR03437 family)